MSEEQEKKYALLLAEHEKTVEKLKNVESKTEELITENEALKLELAAKGIVAIPIAQDDGRQESMQLSAEEPIIFGRCFYRRRIGRKVEYVILAYVRLCMDVLGDVLQFGNRRHLSALERIGRNFHAVIAERFSAKPFLTLTLKTLFDLPGTIVNSKKRKGCDGQFLLAPKDTETIKTAVVSGAAIMSCKCRLKAVIIVGAKIDLPPYLRIGAIEFMERGNLEGGKLVTTRFEQISPLLLQLKSAFVGSRLDIKMSITSTEFDFVQEKLLPLFDCCKHFNFESVKCYSGEGSIFLASLLQHPSIRNALCVEVEFEYPEYHNNLPSAQLPIEAVSNWLHRPCAAITASAITGKMMEKRTLNVSFDKIENLSKMINHLKEVFTTAQTPVLPFSLKLSYRIADGPFLDQTLLNTVSREELSICINKRGWTVAYVTVERRKK